MSEHTCLIVDDEPAIRSFIRAALQPAQLQILEADNAPQALKTVHKLGGRMAFVLSDIRMPGDMDGVDLGYCIHNAFPEVPVILISGYCDEIQELAGFEFIPKPFTPEAILSAVQRALNRTKDVVYGGDRHPAAR